jgi:hypothetical protein
MDLRKFLLESFAAAEAQGVQLLLLRARMDGIAEELAEAVTEQAGLLVNLPDALTDAQKEIIRAAFAERFARYFRSQVADAVSLLEQADQLKPS